MSWPLDQGYTQKEAECLSFGQNLICTFFWNHHPDWTGCVNRHCNDAEKEERVFVEDINFIWWQLRVAIFEMKKRYARKYYFLPLFGLFLWKIVSFSMFLSVYYRVKNFKSWRDFSSHSINFDLATLKQLVPVVHCVRRHAYVDKWRLSWASDISRVNPI